jgi:hypothetical protein
MVWKWKRSAYKVFIGKQEGRFFGRRRGGAEDNFKMDLKQAE